MGIDYIGPIDGHNLKEIIETLTLAKELKKPVIIHAKTIKGKGYQIAEGHHEKWHGVSAFDIQTGNFLNKTDKRSATKIFSDKLLELSIKDEKIVGITAAMPSGTGLDKLIQYFPERFWDVAIAEQHAVTSAAAMAKEGFKPVVAIYSTFLQRGYDQIIHDVAIMDLNVTFAIDRAGIVGNDGETHQGAFDISYLRVVPNLVLLAPRCEKSFELALEFAINLDKPTAIRYPRGNFDDIEFNVSKYQLGKGEILQKGSSDIVFIGYGMGVAKAIKVAKLLNKDITIIDLRFVKPIDEELLLSLVDKSNWYVFSDSAKLGGVGSAVLEVLSKHNILNIKLKTFEYDDKFIPHGNTKEVEKYLQLTPEQIINQIK
jgi:1-deoxy-D-xylulose-5-phosphate synthase